MQPSERVEIITRVANHLAALESRELVELIFTEFGFPGEDTYNGVYFPETITVLQSGDADKLAALDYHLSGRPLPPEGTWADDHFRLFLTHVASQKEAASSLKHSLTKYGVDAFVAHADIEPAKKWLVVVESALYSCDALAGLLHKGFRTSDWCDQEVGIALGRRIPVVPLSYDFPPYGFFGSVQAVNNAAKQEPTALAHYLVRALLKEKAAAASLTQAIVHRLACATSYSQANQLSQILAEEAPLLSQHQAEQLREAEQGNHQLQEAFRFDRHLSSIEAKISDTRHPAAGSRLGSADSF